MGDIQDGTGWEVMERAYHIDRRNKIIEIFIAVLLFFVTVYYIGYLIGREL